MMLVFTIIVAFIIFRGVNSGIESSSKIIMPLLIVLVLGVSVYSLTISYTDIDGTTRTGLQGLGAYVIPNMKGITVKQFCTVLMDAMGQLFYSLSVAMGIMIAYGSYVSDDANLGKSINQIELFDTIVAFLAGVMIIPAVFVFMGRDGMTEKFEDLVRTFCMNPNGIVVNENTNGIVTVNGHSYEGAEKQTENTNFALLVAKHFSEPFKDSNGYGESIARLSNMLGGGVIVQRFGDLMRGRRSTEKRIEEGLVKPTLAATPGDLSLVLPKRILDGIIEMIYALDKIAPGTANDDTLLYGVEVKFYNMEVEIDNNLETRYKGLYIIGDGSGVTHSLSHASASGVYVARKIIEEM